MALIAHLLKYRNKQVQIAGLKIAGKRFSEKTILHQFHITFLKQYNYYVLQSLYYLLENTLYRKYQQEPLLMKQIKILKSKIRAMESLLL